MKCIKCKTTTKFTEELLFDGEKNYRGDVRQIIHMSKEYDQQKLHYFINERRLSSGEKFNKSYTFLLLTCDHCGSQYIVSKKYRDIDDHSDKSTYTSITELKRKENQGQALS